VDFVRAIESQGFGVVPNVVKDDERNALISAIERANHPGSIRRRESIYAIRNLLEAVPLTREIADSAGIRGLVEPLLGPDCFAVRGILFDKVPDANWKIYWHQDLSIAVRKRLDDVPGFGPWTEKAGQVHVQPPAEVLEKMLTIRLHLDNCSESNGPLRVIPGSHLEGRLDSEAIDRWRGLHHEVTCVVPRNGALIMKPLLLHASSASKTPEHRRVIHLEFAAERLPHGLEWACV
jgi:ectoine hydroxylase-related dioxygenase (phytanoyl-CoA dioxygenase family)